LEAEEREVRDRGRREREGEGGNEWKK